MNKLVYLITRKKHSSKLTRALLAHGFSITELEGSGGFSQEKLAIIMLGTDESKIETILGLARKNSAAREEISINGVPLPVLGQEDLVQTQSGNKARIKVGGTIVFITPLDRIEKI